MVTLLFLTVGYKHGPLLALSLAACDTFGIDGEGEAAGRLVRVLDESTPEVEEAPAASDEGERCSLA